MKNEIVVFVWLSVYFLVKRLCSRQAIKATMRKACKCHGVSGSCTIQTCWMQMADFREVGNYLKMKYKHAKELEMDKKAARAGNSADNRDAVTHTFLSVATTELIYLESSPNYCVKNQTLGLHGTEGRECFKEDKNMSEWEKNSCRRLCNECGLKVVKKRTEVFTSCNCKFHWCCTVKCEKCKRVVAKYFCAHKSGRKKSKKGRNSAHQQWLGSLAKFELFTLFDKYDFHHINQFYIYELHEKLFCITWMLFKFLAKVL